MRVLLLVLLAAFLAPSQGQTFVQGQFVKKPKHWLRLTPPIDDPLMPEPRTGHSAVVWRHKMLLFGGLSRDQKFLNDLWTFDFDGLGEPNFNPWKQLAVTDSYSQWFTDKDQRPTTPLRRGVVPARPAGRQGHTAVLIEPQLQQPENTILLGRYLHTTAQDEDQIFIFGGQTGSVSVMESATDSVVSLQTFQSGYKNDLWIYNISSNVLTEVQVQNVNLEGPRGRMGHSMVAYGDSLFMFGGTADEVGMHNECADTVCGDFWQYQFKGQDSCLNQCANHGDCEFGFCVCSAKYRGEDCSLDKCPLPDCRYNYVDHHLECIECNGNGLCNDGSCSCDNGFQGESCEAVWCGQHNCTDADTGVVHGTCKAGGICECDFYHRGDECNITHCPNDCSQRGQCIETSEGGENKTKCECYEAFTGDDCGQYWHQKIIQDSLQDESTASSFRAWGSSLVIFVAILGLTIAFQ